MMNWKGFGRKRSQPERDTTAGFTLKDLRKSTKNSVRVDDGPAETPTKHPQNTSLWHYLYIKFLGPEIGLALVNTVMSLVAP
jgi:hypothetical protein